MSAIDSIRTYSDAALAGAIRSLEFGNTWAERLHVLLKERQRRKRLGITINAHQIKLPL